MSLELYLTLLTGTNTLLLFAILYLWKKKPGSAKKITTERRADEIKQWNGLLDDNRDMIKRIKEIGLSIDQRYLDNDSKWSKKYDDLMLQITGLIGSVKKFTPDRSADEIKQWRDLLDKNGEDYHLIEMLISKFPDDIQIGTELFEKLHEDYYKEENIALKRELLQLLDKLTDKLLLNSSFDNYLETKKLKSTVEKLYADLASDIYVSERTITSERIDQLKALIDKIDDVKALNDNRVLIKEIKEIDSSIDQRYLDNDPKLSKKYDDLMLQITGLIEENEKLIRLKNNRKAIRVTEAVEKKFQKNKSLTGYYENHLVDELVERLDFHKYEGLLQSTLQYCEKIKGGLIEKLSAEQQKIYAKKVVEKKFKEVI